MAGMPNPVVIRAAEIMRHLEKDKIRNNTGDKIKDIPKNNFQLNLFEADPTFLEIKEILENLDINTISPVEALLKLNDLKGKLKK
jgi:DNA mismatch repair protein MutS